MKINKVIITLFLLSGFATASGNDPTEKDVFKSPLHVYSGGIGAGAFYSMSEELRAQNEQTLKFTQTNLLNIKEDLALFFDLDAYFPDFSWGANLGFDFMPGNSGFRPLIGFGAGMNTFEKGLPFGNELGASITAHVGFILGLTEKMKIRMRIPYTFVTNDTRDQVVGLDISFLWSSRFSHIKKLNYR